MVINIKNMVCQRCKIIVADILNHLGMEVHHIAMGQIQLKQPPVQYQLRQLNAALKETGLEIIENKKTALVEKIKDIINERIYHSTEPLTIKFSCYLSDTLQYSYAYLSNLFSRENGISIERYIILQKIEKVKAMLIAGDLFLSEIAYQMNYRSVSHLSNQFKKVTGISASSFKAIRMQQPVLLTA